MTREEQIENYVVSLGISLADAEQLYEDDKADFIGEEAEEITKKAKEVSRTIHQAHEFVRKPKVERVRKENPEKAMIISRLAETIEKIGKNTQVTNTEKYITFSIGENNYELNLVCKRKPKKK